jgi:translation initiation factor 2-alpha kinase 4
LNELDLELTTDSDRKTTGSQVKSSVRSERKAIIGKSHVSADKVNNGKKTSSGDKAEQKRATKHIVIQEASPKFTYRGGGN